jgi:hypothetical protein
MDRNNGSDLEVKNKEADMRREEKKERKGREGVV